jgi:pimeloyl-ACP methyl ester carboxylesterase
MIILDKTRNAGDMDQTIQVRIHGDKTVPTLIYLPGLHGNWTLVGSFRQALAGRVRFVEMTYPPTLTWSLVDYAHSVESILANHGITHGWLLAESFSSQVVWAMLARARFKAEGLILAGGFVRHPAQWGARLAERVAADIPFALLTSILFGYAKVARIRFRHSPETIAGIQEFIARLTEEERRAARHRLHLVAQNDPREIARQALVPVYALTGVLDPVVLWPWVRSWLKKNCPALKDYRIFWWADHNVLGTAPQAAADQVVRWVTNERKMP